MYIEIEKKIIDLLKSTQINYNAGLLTGNSGIALCNYNFFLLKNETFFADNCIKNIEGAISNFNSGNLTTTYCTGIAGFGWLLEYLKENNFLIDSDLDILDEFDEFIIQKMIFDLNNKDVDFLHGAIGYGLYLIKRKHKRKCHDSLIELVRILDEIAVKEIDGSIKWSSIKYRTVDEIIYNISLSHGIASIINILVRIYNAGIAQDKCEFLIHGAMKYLLKQEIDPSKYNSHFPSWAIESEVQLSGSRMAWCYGDLGIAITMWQAGIAFNNSSWEDKAIEVLRFSATKRDLQANTVVDAGICHGTAGVGQIFYRMYWNTQLPEFKEAADFWFNETLKMSFHPDGLAGYKAWYGEENGGWKNEFGLLEGVAGIGLALLTYYNQLEPSWDECFLLS